VKWRFWLRGVDERGVDERGRMGAQMYDRMSAESCECADRKWDRKKRHCPVCFVRLADEIGLPEDMRGGMARTAEGSKMSEKELGVRTKWGTIEPMQSNGIPVCLRCGVAITPENDSGWEAFTEDGRTTQPTCKKCQDEDSKRTSVEKADD